MFEIPVAQKSETLLRNRNFLWLWAGQSLSLIGDNFFLTTIVLWMIDQLARGENWLPLAISGVALCAILPSLLLGPIAGVFVDRWDRRQTMIWTDIGRFVLILLFLLITLFVLDRTIVLISCFVILLLVSCGSQFFLPARLALVADLVPEEQRPDAYGSLWQAFYLAQIGGPSLAAPLYVALGPTWAIVTNACSFLVSFLFLLLMRVPALEGSNRERSESFWKAFTLGWQFFVRSRVLVVLTTSSMLFLFGGMAYNSLEYLFGLENLHIPEQLIGLYAGCYGIGIVIGMPVMAKLSRRISDVTLYWLSLIANGIALLVLSRLTTMIPGMICEVVSGLLSASILLVRQPLTVLVTPREMIGRVSAFQTPLITLSSLLGGSLAGLFATALSGMHIQIAGMIFGRLDTIMVAIALLTIGTGVFARLFLSPAVKAYRAKLLKENEGAAQH